MSCTPCQVKRVKKIIAKARSLKLDAAADDDDDEDGDWITSNGQHIFIPKGKDKGEVVKKHFDDLGGKTPAKKHVKDEADGEIKQRQWYEEDEVIKENNRKRDIVRNEYTKLIDQGVPEVEAGEIAQAMHDKIDKEDTHAELRKTHAKERLDRDVALGRREKPREINKIDTSAKSLAEEKKPKFKDYNHTQDWTDAMLKKYTKKEFAGSEMYRQAYPEIKKLEKEHLQREAAKIWPRVKEKGHKVGDILEYTAPSPYGTVEEIVGMLYKDINGFPRIKDRDRKRKTWAWHKGYEKVKSARGLHAVDAYNKDGKYYVKTFLINDKRNNNGWKASWSSIKKNHKSFIGRPGIEYNKCTSQGCQLDHTDGYSKSDALHQQEQYRVSTIVDTELDHDNKTAYATHEIHDKEFAEKIKRKEIQFLSPSIWPNGEKTTQTLTDRDEWYIDTTDWKGLHSAFVDSPAFGHTAKIVEDCTGDKSCINDMRNKSLNASKILIYVRAWHTLQAVKDKDGNEGDWITSNGHKIFIPKGKDKGKAVKEHFEQFNKKLNDESAANKKRWDKKDKEKKRRLDKMKKKSTVPLREMSHSQLSAVADSVLNNGSWSDGTQSIGKLDIDFKNDSEGDRPKIYVAYNELLNIFHGKDVDKDKTKLLDKKMNDYITKIYDNSTHLHRGTSTGELDNMLKHNVMGAGGGRYNFVSLTTNASAANDIALIAPDSYDYKNDKEEEVYGVVLDFKKDSNFEKHIVHQGYEYGTSDGTGVSDPQGSDFLNEEEHRFKKNTVPIGDIATVINIMGVPENKQAAMAVKYESIGKVNFIKESMSEWADAGI